MSNLSSSLGCLQQQALGADTEAAKEAFAALTAIGNEDVVRFYLGLLETSAPRWRNWAAMELAALADERALKPLLQAIQRPENLGRNGTLVYALTSFDCRHLLKELFVIAFWQGYEAQLLALNAITEQDFEYSAEDMLFIRQQWMAAKLAPSTSLLDFDFDSIQELVDDF